MAGALQAMKSYKEAAGVLNDGLDKCPGKEHLAVKLEIVAKEQNVVSSSTLEAESVSHFVKLSRFALEFEISAMQAQP